MRSKVHHRLDRTELPSINLSCVTEHSEAMLRACTLTESWLEYQGKTDVRSRNEALAALELTSFRPYSVHCTFIRIRSRTPRRADVEAKSLFPISASKITTVSCSRGKRREVRTCV